MLNLGSSVLRIYKNTNTLDFSCLFFSSVCRVRGENLQRPLSISSRATEAKFDILCLELHIWIVTVTRMVAFLCLPLLSSLQPSSLFFHLPRFLLLWLERAGNRGVIEVGFLRPIHFFFCIFLRIYTDIYTIHSSFSWIKENNTQHVDEQIADQV